MALGAKAGDVYLEGHYRNAASFGREMTAQVQTPSMRAGAEASKHFSRKFAAGLAVGGALIGAGLYKATRAAARGIQAATDKASDLNETINKSNVIFGKNAAEIQKWSRGSARSMGLSRQEALANASAFGDMFLQLKIGQPQAVKMSKGMVQLAADFASFHNADISDVLLAQQSAFRGEYDALQRFVPGINAARVEQEALRETHKKSAKDLTLAEKAQATYNIMLHDGARASGDFKRTSDQLANTRRIEKAQIEDLQAALGKRFLPAQLAVHRAFSEKVLPALGLLVRTYGPAVERTATRWATSFANVIPSTRDLQLGLRALGEAFQGGGIATSSDSFVGKMERIGVAARKVVDWFKTLRPQFSSLGRSANEVGPALASAGGGGHVFANALTVVAPVLDVVARNIHNILPWLPVLLTGFLAFRAVRSVIAPVRDLSQTIANFASPAVAAATFLNARAQKALAAAMREQAAAAVESAAANRAVATSIAASGTSAEVATAKWGASGVAAGAAASKWSQLASALGIVGAALVVGDIVDRLTDKLGRFKRITEVAAGPLGLLGIQVGGLKDAWAAMTGSQDRAAASTRVAMTAAERHTAALRSEHDAVSALKSALAGEETAELDVRQAKLNVASAQKRLTDLTRDGHKGSVEYKQAQLDLRRAQLDLRARTDEYKAAQLRANAATGGALHASQQATPAVRHLGETAQTAGVRLYTSGTKAREGMGIASRAASGFRSNFNHQVDLLHGKSVNVTATAAVRIADSVRQYLAVAQVPGFHATGGPIRGPGTGTSDSIPAMLSAGEHVWTAEEVQKAGGHRAVEQMRAQVRGYALGGPVVDLRLRASKAPDLQRMFQHPVDRATERIGNLVATGLASRIGRGLSKAIEKGLAGGSAAVKRFILSTDRLPYRWGATGPFAYDCSGLVGAVYGKMRGDRRAGHGRRYFTTASISSATPGLKAGLGGVLDIGVTPSIGHMVGRYGGLNFEARSTATGIFTGSAARSPASFARRYHMARGGRVDGQMIREFQRLGFDIGGDPSATRVAFGETFDRGGWLMPGTTVAHNRTGRPERVSPPGEGSIHLTVNIHNHGPIIGDARAFAREATAEVRSELRRQLRREGKTALANQL